MRHRSSFYSASKVCRQVLVIGLAPVLAFLISGQAAIAETVSGPPPAGKPVTQDTTAEVPAAATVPVGPSVDSPASVLPAPKRLSVMEAIGRAKELLRQELAKRQASGRKAPIYDSTPAVADVTIAVWDRLTDRIDLYEASKQGLLLTLKTPGAPPIRVRTSAKLYSRYEVRGDANKLIVGVLYPVAVQTWLNKQLVYTTRPTVYVPYSNEFYRPDVLASGSNYLSRVIKEAFDDLSAKQVLSRAFPGRPLAEVVDPYLIKSIAIIEHLNYQSLAKDEEPEGAVGAFLVKLALNQEEAFGEVVSSAGARGLVQFIPSTYALTVRNRPDIGLIPDFKSGMSDHKNAVKAEVAYLDQALAEMPDGLKKLYASDSARAAEFLAAAYNGGPARVRTAYNAWGDDWVGAHLEEIRQLSVRNEALIDEIEAMKARLKKTSDQKQITQLENNIWGQRVVRKGVLARLAELNKGSLKQETMIYVAKLKKVYGMLTAGYFATPDAPANAILEPNIPVVTQAPPADPSAPAIQALPQPSLVMAGGPAPVRP